MQSLENHLRFRTLDSKARYLQQKNRYRDFFGNYYDLIEEKFNEEPFNKDYILEMFQSHDAQLLIDYLSNRVLSKIDKKITISKETSGVNTNIFIKTPSNLIADVVCLNKEFNQLLFYFNYYITLRENSIIHLEPKFTDKVNNFIFYDCCGVVYHITKKVYLENILRKGIRCMKSSYREFPEKIFLYATKNFKHPKEADKELKEFAKSIDHYGEDFIVLKINLNSQSNINIYKDAGVDCEGACYTFDNIHPQFIKVYRNTIEL